MFCDYLITIRVLVNSSMIVSIFNSVFFTATSQSLGYHSTEYIVICDHYWVPWLRAYMAISYKEL